MKKFLIKIIITSLCIYLFCASIMIGIGYGFYVFSESHDLTALIISIILSAIFFIIYVFDTIKFIKLYKENLKNENKVQNN